MYLYLYTTCILTLYLYLYNTCILNLVPHLYTTCILTLYLYIYTTCSTAGVLESTDGTPFFCPVTLCLSSRFIQL